MTSGRRCSCRGKWRLQLSIPIQKYLRVSDTSRIIEGLSSGEVLIWTVLDKLARTQKDIIRIES